MEKTNKTIIWVLLAIYIASTIYLTVLCRTATDTMQYRLDLFWEIERYLNGDPEFGRQICQNILLFIPIGFLSYSASKNCKIAFLIGLLTSLIIEISQLLFRLGLFELDDILNNTLGTIIGIAISAILLKILKNEKIYTIIAILVGIASVALSIYANIKY